ncbi:hypothetical protein GF325_00790, partial [Candidatus Bathyarchaeota archaeon]|nr:hypothetical protein [Candidatus Bathyarchaeota archaeon]
MDVMIAPTFKMISMDDTGNIEVKIDYEELDSKRIGQFLHVNLPPLTTEEEDIINPLIPPTSGIRISLLEKKDGVFHCPASRYCMFLRIFKAISLLLLEKMGHPAKILITSDERPTGDRLVRNAMQVLAVDEHEFVVQRHEPGDLPLSKFIHSGLSTPYSSSCIAIFDDIDAVICVTASHNSIQWNGVKFYLNVPIPIAGDLMRSISNHALQQTLIKMIDADKITVHGRDCEVAVNDYIKDLMGKVIPLEGVSGKTIIVWPYMGKAPGIVNLLQDLGVNVKRIDKQMEPPDPTVNFPRKEIIETMKQHDARIAVMLDADRDRIVFMLKRENAYQKMNPNELYT